MHTETSITINASRERIFETASNLALWPRILPHYRWVRYLSSSPSKNVVVMAAKRKWIPIRWTSEQTIDREKHEIRFHHLRAFTRGMRVVWTMVPTDEGVLVRIEHDLAPRLPVLGAWFAEKVIGKFFVSYVAGQTLKHLKRYLESSPDE